MSSRLWGKKSEISFSGQLSFLIKCCRCYVKIACSAISPCCPNLYVYLHFRVFNYSIPQENLQLEVLWRLHFFGDNGQYHTMFPRMLFQADIKCSQKLMTFIDFLFLFHVKWQNSSEIEAVNSATWVGYLGIRTKTRRPLKQIYKPTEQNRSIHWRRRI